MILVDLHGHMVATESEEELHVFAKKIGLKRKWFQQPKKPLMRHAHYDLTTRKKIGEALDAGAKFRDNKELLTRAWWAEEEIPRGLKFWNLVALILGKNRKKKRDKKQMKIKISHESIIHDCPKCGSQAVMGMHKETTDKMTGKIIKEDKTTKLNCLKCGHKFWRKRMKFKTKKEAT